MQIILNAPGIHHRTKEGVEKELEEYLPRLKQVLFRFRPEEKRLRVHLAQQKDSAYRLTLSLRMPGKNLIVERTGHNLIPLVTEAKQALLEQIKVQSAVVRKDHLRAKSMQQSQAIREAVGGASGWRKEAADEEEMRERFVFRLGLVLQELYSHVRRLIRFSQLAGDIPVNHLKPGEVVDDVLVRGYELFRSQPEGEFSHATCIGWPTRSSGTKSAITRTKKKAGYPSKRRLLTAIRDGRSATWGRRSWHSTRRKRFCCTGM